RRGFVGNGDNGHSGLVVGGNGFGTQKLLNGEQHINEKRESICPIDHNRLMALRLGKRWLGFRRGLLNLSLNCCNDLTDFSLLLLNTGR
ncbi:MAG: hypothetical protein RLZZ490_298, partial [Cyanobacteriota bacterium]